ncbi:hypothetical protein A3F03_04795 [Candidatus Roizmanbacteria bacterium RIFCSPHIGHO2_12_FULL_41_11]|uniref:Undecaprenyl-diphosphatase n=3 Tax=Candidatus Roizmaniibacteriota TaxID=1752723 RepID=A0A1F7JQC8_9BACT|nr:MAG: hypothetical protein A3F03_04795 [Candidatus Roizmanbacteria bacterium RIFCSPHIGHO2_12_FULL_41_11]OGK51820.1 MAG: hypothetical protein A2966_00330 [Candidatus Roizmanbacteria bacterium RIFCSPLOWO2_01_FULL_41_22]OGK57815.1 MAG: hypothetical protein A3H86_01665 [Candidatus Roizmanbacteria bacterium RIFCSPLOWO2_02_FULL_41_9]
MNIIQSLILGLVEGITEFLPISSTFHLIFTSKLMGIQATDFIKLFEVVIQAGAILAVLFLYFRQWWQDRQLVIKILVSFLPTAVIGFFLYKIIKTVFFESSYLMIVMFIAVGLVFLLIEYLVSQNKLLLNKSIQSLNYQTAIFVGLVQSLAVIPGVSRAGAVIVAMMGLGIKREEAAKYSFMLSVPTIFAASAWDAWKMRNALTADTGQIYLLFIGFMMAFISAYFVVKWLITYLQNHSLKIFGWYRLVVGIIMLMIGS